MPQPLLEAWGNTLLEHYDRIIGGDIEETMKGHGIYRGPITEVCLIDSGYVDFTVSQMFVKRIDPSGNPRSNDWQEIDAPNRSFCYHILNVDDPEHMMPQLEDGNRLTFPSGNFVSATVYFNTHPGLLPRT